MPNSFIGLNGILESTTQYNFILLDTTTIYDTMKKFTYIVVPNNHKIMDMKCSAISIAKLNEDPYMKFLNEYNTMYYLERSIHLKRNVTNFKAMSKVKIQKDLNDTHVLSYIRRKTGIDGQKFDVLSTVVVGKNNEINMDYDTSKIYTVDQYVTERNYNKSMQLNKLKFLSYKARQKIISGLNIKVDNGFLIIKAGELYLNGNDIVINSDVYVQVQDFKNKIYDSTYKYIVLSKNLSTNLYEIHLKSLERIQINEDFVLGYLKKDNDNLIVYDYRNYNKDEVHYPVQVIENVADESLKSLENIKASYDEYTDIFNTHTNDLINTTVSHETKPETIIFYKPTIEDIQINNDYQNMFFDEIQDFDEQTDYSTSSDKIISKEVQTGLLFSDIMGYESLDSDNIRCSKTDDINFDTVDVMFNIVVNTNDNHNFNKNLIQYDTDLTIKDYLNINNLNSFYYLNNNPEHYSEFDNYFYEVQKEIPIFNLYKETTVNNANNYYIFGGLDDNTDIYNNKLYKYHHEITTGTHEYTSSTSLLSILPVNLENAYGQYNHITDEIMILDKNNGRFYTYDTANSVFKVGNYIQTNDTQITNATGVNSSMFVLNNVTSVLNNLMFVKKLNISGNYIARQVSSIEILDRDATYMSFDIDGITVVSASNEDQNIYTFDLIDSTLKYVKRVNTVKFPMTIYYGQNSKVNGKSTNIYNSYNYKDMLLLGGLSDKKKSYTTNPYACAITHLYSGTIGENSVKIPIHVGMIQNKFYYDEGCGFDNVISIFGGKKQQKNITYYKYMSDIDSHKYFYNSENVRDVIQSNTTLTDYVLNSNCVALNKNMQTYSVFLY